MAKPVNATDMVAIVKDCFKTNKEAKSIFVTSDGQCFLENNKSAAERHARISKLDMKEVFRYQVVEGEKVAEEKAAEPDATDLDPKYGKMLVADLKALCTERQIVFDDATAKKKDLILSLEAADEAKKTAAPAAE